MGHRAGDAVVGGLACAAPQVHVLYAADRVGAEFELHAPVAALELGEQEGVAGHQIFEGGGRVVVPAGRVDVEDHGNVVWALEAHGPQQVLAHVHEEGWSPGEGAGDSRELASAGQLARRAEIALLSPAPLR